mmetsp:Transcript_53147/g.64021  ORF Transcript_53147/g.64021 Transcript_53147/m.64021 type:complete len:444 (+) Transcript_53147:193-1524(+)
MSLVTLSRPLLRHHLNNNPAAQITTRLQSVSDSNDDSYRNNNFRRRGFHDKRGHDKLAKNVVAGASPDVPGAAVNDKKGNSGGGDGTREKSSVPTNGNDDVSQRRRHETNRTPSRKAIPRVKHQELSKSIYNHPINRYHNKGGIGGGTSPKDKLAVVDGSPLLDPVSYCRKSSFFRGDSGNISGTAAARRLRLGRKEVVAALNRAFLGKEDGGAVAVSESGDVTGGDASSKRGEAFETTKTLRNKSKQGNKTRSRQKYARTLTPQHSTKSFVLTGHGVPEQLLEDHIDLCDAVLSRHGPKAECSFHNICGDLNVDWMCIRKPHRDNTVSRWPPPSRDDDIEHRLNLYLTVMNRLATTIQRALNNDNIKYYNGPHWNVKLLRGLSYPPFTLPFPNQLQPIVELRERRCGGGDRAVRGVKVTLQSLPACAVGRRRPVTCVFDSRF